MLQGVISDYVGFRQINYLCDVLLIILLLVMACRKQITLTKTIKNIENVSIVAFAVVVPQLYTDSVSVLWIYVLTLSFSCTLLYLRVKYYKESYINCQDNFT